MNEHDLIPEMWQPGCENSALAVIEATRTDGSVMVGQLVPAHVCDEGRGARILLVLDYSDDSDSVAELHPDLASAVQILTGYAREYSEGNVRWIRTPPGWHPVDVIPTRGADQQDRILTVDKMVEVDAVANLSELQEIVSVLPGSVEDGGSAGVRAWLHRCGWSIAEAARRTGVSASSISRWTRGTDSSTVPRYMQQMMLAVDQIGAVHVEPWTATQMTARAMLRWVQMQGSQSRAARALGVTQSQVSRWCGEERVVPSYITRLMELQDRISAISTALPGR